MFFESVVAYQTLPSVSIAAPLRCSKWKAGGWNTTGRDLGEIARTGLTVGDPEISVDIDTQCPRLVDEAAPIGAAGAVAAVGDGNGPVRRGCGESWLVGRTYSRWQD